MKKINYLDFSKQDIFVGIDVHHKRWVVSIVINDILFGPFSQDPKVSILVNYLRNNFPGGIYHCVYESGFSGFWIYEELMSNGLDCIVVNPADVPTTNKEKDRKTDKRDSRKLARCLSHGELEGIYVHDKKRYEERSLIRTRESLVQEQTRCKNRIKGLLKFFGISLSDDDASKHWSNKFIDMLENIHTEHSWAAVSLRFYIDQLRHYRKLISEITVQIRKLSETESYSQDIINLTSVPGVGTVSAMILLTELGDINRFKTLDKLCSYIGLIPSEHSSGETENRSRMTRRGKGILRRIVIEGSWVAIRKDPGLLMKYNELCKRMKKGRAIISISRRFIARIMFVLKNNEEYKFLPVR